MVNSNLFLVKHWVKQLLIVKIDEILVMPFFFFSAFIFSFFLFSAFFYCPNPYPLGSLRADGKPARSGVSVVASPSALVAARLHSSTHWHWLRLADTQPAAVEAGTMVALRAQLVSSHTPHG